MKNTTLMFVLGIAILLFNAACTKEDPITPKSDHLVLDSNEIQQFEGAAGLAFSLPLGKKITRISDDRDGQIYQAVSIDGKLWMTRNLNYEMSGSWIYNNIPTNAKTFGRLYTWEAAQQACPDGWRMPTMEDWEELIAYLGGYGYAYSKLIDGGSTGFEAQLGGWYNQEQYKFNRQGLVGLYWTGSEGANDSAWRYKFYPDIHLVYRHEMPREMAYSCRCMTDDPDL